MQQLVLNASSSVPAPPIVRSLRPAAARAIQPCRRRQAFMRLLHDRRPRRGCMVHSNALELDTGKWTAHGASRQTMYLDDDEARKRSDIVDAVRAAVRSMGEVSKTYSQLFMVDTLEKVGISQYFSYEIRRILDMAYKSWQQKDHEMIMDKETCGMAFRILRMHGYGVSSDVLSHFHKESRVHDSVSHDTKALLELYKASKVRIFEDESTLDKVGSWTAELLRQQLCSGRISTTVISQEVEYALQLPFYSSTLEPLEHKRNIEHFIANGIQISKPASLPCHVAEDILALAVAEFHSAQSHYQQELQYMDRWVKEVRLDQLNFLRMLPLDVYFFLASSVLPRESSEARIAWIQNCILSTTVDDLFDVAGSSEELQNLIALFEKWDAHDEIGFCSENVEIVFYAVYNTNKKIGARAAEIKNRSVNSHIAGFWADMARAMMKEAEWSRERYTPTMEEYMPVAEASFGVGPVTLMPLYLIGPELSEEVVRGSEFGELLRLTNVCGRLLNDMGSYMRESADGKITNSVLLLAGGASSVGEAAAAVDAAKEEIRRTVEASKRELLRLVTREAAAAAGGGGVPRACKDVFWNMCKVANLTYLQANGYCSTEEMVGAARAVVHEPLKV